MKQTNLFMQWMLRSVLFILLLFSFNRAKAKPNTVTDDPPKVVSIVRAISSPTNKNLALFIVTFSENVSGVYTGSFNFTTTGSLTVISSSITSPDPTRSSKYNVNIVVSGEGTIRLDLKSSGTYIVDDSMNPIVGGYTSGDIIEFDHTPPTTTITKKPALVTTSNTAEFNFSSSEPAGALYQYSLDGGTFKYGDNPLSLTSLPLGSHTILVRAEDRATNVDPNPVRYIWTIIPFSLPATVLPNAAPGFLYNEAINPAIGGVPTYTYAVSSGALPPGILLSANGTLNGIPTTPGTYNFIIAATDSSVGEEAPFITYQVYQLKVNNKLKQTILLAYESTALYGDPDIDLKATASSGLPITYTSQDPNSSSIINGKVHIIKAARLVIYADQPGNDKYESVTAQHILTVERKPLTITVNNRSKVYGQLVNFAGTEFTSNGLVNNDAIAVVTLTSTGAAESATVAGSTYPIEVATIAGSGLSNYEISYVYGTLTVTPKALTITANNLNKTYGDAVTFAGTEFTSAGLINGNTVTGVTLTSAGAPATATVAGSTYPIVASVATGTGLNNYTITYTNGALTVTPKVLTITANNSSKTYGDVATFASTEFTSNGLINGNTATGVTLTSTGATATATVAGSTYPIVASAATGTGLDNYTIAYVNGALTITPKVLTITANNLSKTYGDAETFAGTEFTSAGLTNGNTVTGVTLTSSGAAESATVAGSTYPIIASAAKGTGLDNYTISYAYGALTVIPKALTITANNLSKTYGDAVTFAGTEFTSAGLTNGNTVTGVTLTSAGAPATATVAGSTYPIVASVATGTGLNNYTITYTNGALTVIPKTLTITANNSSKTYGDVATFASTDFTSNGLTNGNTVTGVTLTSTGAPETATVAGSTYQIVASAATGTGLDNYTIAYVNGALTITPKALTITANNSSKTYGDAATFAGTEFTSAGLTNGNTVTGVTLISTGAPATATVAGSTYQIVASAATGTGLDNYTISYVNGALTITPKALTITANNSSKVYGDALTFADTEFTSNGLTNGNTVTGVTLTTTGAPAIATVAGSTYPIAASAATGTGLENYTIAYVNGALTVTPKALTITANNSSKVYGDALTFAGTEFTSNGLTNGNTVTGVTLTTTGAPAIATVAGSTYPIAASAATGTGLENYTIAYVNGALTVTPKALTITANNSSKVYGDVLTFAGTEFTSNGLTNGNTVTGATLTTTGASAIATVAGSTYPIVASAATGTGLDNYTIAYLNGALTVTPKALTITANNQERFKGAPNPTLTVGYTGFANNETSAVLSTQPAISTTAVLNSEVGNYPITVSGATAANYNISYVAGILKVKAGAPTSITLTPAILYENGPAGTNAGTLSTISDDPTATFTYTLVGGTGNTDNTLFSTSGNKINTTASLDFESKPVYKIRLRSTTSSGLWIEQVLSINILDVNEAPTLNVIDNQNICYTTSAQSVPLTGISAGPDAGQTTTLSASSNNQDLFNSLTAAGSGSIGTISYRLKTGATGTATITLTVKDNGGTANGGVDTYSRNFLITVNALPVVIINSNKGAKVSKGETIELTATGGAGYEWTINNSVLKGEKTAVLTVRPKETTTYMVTATNASGCKDIQNFTITVLDDMKIKPTNILTPNGDGYNDKWIVENIDFYPDNHVKIFDKAGRVLYEKNGYDNSWDGTVNGRPVAEGTYYYLIDFGKDRQVLKGFITIIREQ